MNKPKLLAIFEITRRNEREKFSIYGNYEIETNADYKNDEYKYPEFYNLSANKHIGGKEQYYKPTGSTWAGRIFNVKDMINECLADLIKKGTDFTVVFLEEGLQNLVNGYISEENVASTYNDLPIPKRILGNNMHDIYELSLVTDKYIYYMYYDKALMLEISSHKLVSDNYFASEGYLESVENIRNGKETPVWGEYEV